MAGEYFVRIRGVVSGPFPLAHLRGMVERGNLGRMHDVSEDRQSWVRAGSMGELFAGRAGLAPQQRLHATPAAPAGPSNEDLLEQVRLLEDHAPAVRPASPMAAPAMPKPTRRPPTLVDATAPTTAPPIAQWARVPRDALNAAKVAEQADAITSFAGGALSLVLLLNLCLPVRVGALSTAWWQGKAFSSSFTAGLIVTVAALVAAAACVMAGGLLKGIVLAACGLVATAQGLYGYLSSGLPWTRGTTNLFLLEALPMLAGAVVGFCLVRVRCRAAVLAWPTAAAGAVAALAGAALLAAVLDSAVVMKTSGWPRDLTLLALTATLVAGLAAAAAAFVGEPFQRWLNGLAVAGGSLTWLILIGTVVHESVAAQSALPGIWWAMLRVQGNGDLFALLFTLGVYSFAANLAALAA